MGLIDRESFGEVPCVTTPLVQLIVRSQINAADASKLILRMSTKLVRYSTRDRCINRYQPNYNFEQGDHRLG